MISLRLPSLLSDILLVGAVLAISLAAYAVAVEPWLAEIETLH